MTNGEKLEQVFPDGICPFSKKWLDCEYKKSSLSSALEKNSQKLENVSPIIDWNNCHTTEQLGSIATTKNDLAVDKARSDSELIARGDVLNTIKETAQYHTGDSFNADRLIRYIKELPSVTPQEPRWIPVSEKLPEDSGEYLVSVIDEYNEDQSYYKAVEVAWFAHKKDYDIKESEWRELGIDEKVIAWMSLPKAYREVEE